MCDKSLVSVLHIFIWYIYIYIYYCLVEQIFFKKTLTDRVNNYLRITMKLFRSTSSERIHSFD